jgi:hypothetical protein
VGVKLKPNNREMMAAARTGPAGGGRRRKLHPAAAPLIITEEEADEALAKLDATFAAWNARSGSGLTAMGRIVRPGTEADLDALLDLARLGGPGLSLPECADTLGNRLALSAPASPAPCRRRKRGTR